MRPALRRLVGVAGFLALWELAARTGVVNPEYLPPASLVGARLAELLVDRAFLLDTVATVLAAAIALGVAALIAIPAGLLLGSLPLLRLASSVLIEFLRPIPSVALIPLAIVLLGTGAETKIALAGFAAVWPILFNTVYALGEVDPQLVDSARSFGVARWRVLLLVKLPSAAPFVMTGVRLSAAVSLAVVVSTELLAAGSGGLGRVIMTASTGGGQLDLALAATVVTGLIGYLANAGLAGAQRRWLAWAPDGGRL